MDNNVTPQGAGKGLAAASLVCGIVSLVFAFFGLWALIGIILSIVGMVLAVIAKKQIPAGQPTGMATGGLVCSIIALVLSTILFLTCAVCVGGLAALGALS